jgi:anti-sigma factor RsiW
MHSVVIENLEEFLAGTLEPSELRVVEAHLSDCAVCRETVHSMQDVSLLFGSLRMEAPIQPDPGFYARVMQRTEESKPAPFLAGLFGLNGLFGRKLVFSSLLALGILGGYLFSQETSYMAGPTPEAVMAEQTRASFDSAPPSENMLVTLTGYEH